MVVVQRGSAPKPGPGVLPGAVAGGVSLAVVDPGLNKTENEKDDENDTRPSNSLIKG